MINDVNLRTPSTTLSVANAPTPASGIATGISNVSGSTSDLQLGENIFIKNLEDFPSLFRHASLDALFNAAKSSVETEKLKVIFQESNNTRAVRDVTGFAEMFKQALNISNNSPDMAEQVMKLGDQYTQRILKDGLGPKSAFGPWTPVTDKQHKSTESLENKLLKLINDNLGGQSNEVSANFIAKDVMPHIVSCLEQYFGSEMTRESRAEVGSLVDRAASKAIRELQECHAKLTEEQGASVGKESRNLEMCAQIPLLLREIFSQIPKELHPPEKVPDVVDGPGSAPAKTSAPGGFNINININNSDNSVHNSGNTIRKESGVRMFNIGNALSDKNTQLGDSRFNETSKSSVSHNGQNRADMQDTQSVGVKTVSTIPQQHSAVVESVAGTLGRDTLMSNAQVDGIGPQLGALEINIQPASGKLVSTIPQQHSAVVESVAGTSGRGALMSNAQVGPLRGAAETSRPNMQLVDGKLLSTSSLSTASQNGIGLQRGALEINIQPASGKLVSTDLPHIAKAEVVDGQGKVATLMSNTQEVDNSALFTNLVFKRNGVTSDSIPSAARLRSVNFNSRSEFLNIIRKATEMDPATPFQTRKAFDGLRTQVLPNSDSVKTEVQLKCTDIDNHQELKQKIDTFCQVISDHPSRDKLSGIALMMARESGLTAKKGHTDYLLSKVLDTVIGNSGWREGPAIETYMDSVGAKNRVILTVDGLH